MKYRIYISELIRRWNNNFRGSEAKMTMITLAEQMWPKEKRARLVKRNKLHRLNVGKTKGIKFIDAINLCIILNCDFNQLFGRDIS